MTTAQKLAASAETSRITCMERVTDDGPRPYWRAHITLDGRTFTVDNRYGSWMEVQQADLRRHVKPAYAARLQDRVRVEMRKLQAATS